MRPRPAKRPRLAVPGRPRTARAGPSSAPSRWRCAATPLRSRPRADARSRRARRYDRGEALDVLELAADGVGRLDVVLGGDQHLRAGVVEDVRALRRRTRRRRSRRLRTRCCSGTASPAGHRARARRWRASSPRGAPPPRLPRTSACGAHDREVGVRVLARVKVKVVVKSHRSRLVSDSCRIAVPDTRGRHDPLPAGRRYCRGGARSQGSGRLRDAWLC